MLHPEIDSERGTTQETYCEEITTLNARTSSDLNVDASVENTDESLSFRGETKAKPMFAIKTWQRLYAVALLETDTVRLSLLSLLAEEAILDRYIELIADVRESVEIVDLRSAVIVLSQLREANQPGYGATNFVA